MSFASMEVTHSGRIDLRRAAHVATPEGRVHRPHDGSPDSRPQFTDWTDRLLGNAAAELRTPLSRVAQSIQTLASGELGQISRLQRDCLADAAAACQKIDQMITGLGRLSQQRGGGQGVMRCWFDLQSLRQEVERTIAQTVPHRKVSITWQGFQAGQYLVFADPSRLCLLIVGLLSSALQRTPKGQPLLVRATAGSGNQTVRLSVTDDRLASSPAPRATGEEAAVPEQSGCSVESAVWQRLSAVLLTELNMRRRAGRGREVSFELPAAGLRSVAIQWAQWRLRHTGRLKPRKRIDAFGPIAQSDAGPLHPDEATVLSINAGAAVSLATVEAFNLKVQGDSRIFDLVYRISPRRWVVIWDADVAQARARMEQLAAADLDSASPLRLSWSSIGKLPIREVQTANVLADRLARELLSDSDFQGFLVEQCVSDGQPLLAPSTVPADRLGAELKHLAARVGAQNELLQQQARALRHRR